MKIGRYLTIGIIGMLFILTSVVGQAAENTETESATKEKTGAGISLKLDANSHYLWRGFNLDNNTVVQSELDLSWCNGITIGVWANFDTDSDYESREIDCTFDYTYTKDKWSFSMGHNFFEYTEANYGSKEFYLGVGLDTKLSPTLTYYLDYGDEKHDNGGGWYLLLEGCQTIPIKKTSNSLILNGHIGINHRVGISGDGGDIGFQAGLEIPLGENAKLTPNLYYSIPFGDVSSADDGAQKNELSGGVSFTYDF